MFDEYSFGQKWANHRMILNAIKFCVVVIFDLMNIDQMRNKTSNIVSHLRETRRRSNYLETM